VTPGFKNDLLDTLSDIRNEVALVEHGAKAQHFAGSGHVRRLAKQVNRLETVVTHMLETLA
jgi:hypothetical protein